MERPVDSGRKHSLFALAAAIAPVTQVASDSVWIVTLVMALAAILLGKWCRIGTGWVRMVQNLWGCVIISVLMDWSTFYWQTMPFAGAVPMILVALAIWTANVPGKAGRIGCVLLWPLVILLGSVLLSGIPEITVQYLKPKWQSPDFRLLPMQMIPFLAPKEKRKGEWKLPLTSVAVSVITVGILSTPVTTAVPSGIYELSRSLSLLGVAERFESIIAAAMTMGLFLSMTFFLEPSEGSKTWLYGVVAVGIYFLKIPVKDWVLALGSILIWIVLPMLGEGKIFSKKGKKGIDKSDSLW